MTLSNHTSSTYVLPGFELRSVHYELLRQTANSKIFLKKHLPICKIVWPFHIMINLILEKMAIIFVCFGDSQIWS